MLIGVYLRRTGCRVGVISYDAIAKGGVLPAGKINLWVGRLGVDSAFDMVRTMKSGRDVKKIDAEVLIPGFNGNPASMVVDEAAELHGVEGYVHDA